MLTGLSLLARGFDLIGVLAESIQKSHVSRGMVAEGLYRYIVPTPDKTEVQKDISQCNIKLIIKGKTQCLCNVTNSSI